MDPILFMIALFAVLFGIPITLAFALDPMSGKRIRMIPVTTETKMVRLWHSTARFPFGHTLYNWMIHAVIPFSGTVNCKITEIGSGTASGVIKNRWSNRNYDGRICPSAFVALQEYVATVSLATVAIHGLEPKFEAMSISFGAPPIGDVTAECESSLPRVGAYENGVIFTDSLGNKVAFGKCFWNVARKG